MPEHGEFREDGYWWDAEYEEWNSPDFKHAYMVEQDENGKWHAAYVYMGYWNCEVTEADEQKYSKDVTDEEYYQWLYKNRKIR